ncbi:RNA polymerase sigma-70 factor (ECF subfamily) [Mucilaginibacter gracilis]|uniref:RNA polymerase sigma-70 factor (ECF subfamily) n=1 Tax=Mucilaginibacter gracilis TaxID=423350 RepID=A0A495IZQ2_9SPHI|nr:RNA polymerase sigma-70 factor [Mucilaginibacter gracilis]RKR81861.1 RNA polymerase sigma-70 factor (ECF subfamily) [Mucilaginibacter gracilis]
MSIYSKLTDTDLAALLTQSNRLAFAEIYDRYKGILFVHAYRRLANSEEAEDVIHDLFINLWNKREDLNIKNHMSGYLYTALRNRIFDVISRKKIESAYMASIDLNLVASAYITDHKVRESELAKIIEKEIAALPEKMREVFLLSRKQNLNHKEIAEKLGISEQTVSKQITRALRILRMRLGIVVYIIYIFKLH